MPRPPRTIEGFSVILVPDPVSFNKLLAAICRLSTRELPVGLGNHLFDLRRNIINRLMKFVRVDGDLRPTGTTGDFSLTVRLDLPERDADLLAALGAGDV